MGEPSRTETPRDELLDHTFSPLTFYNKDGLDPVHTDWCGRLDGEEVCGQLAAAHREAEPERIEGAWRG